MQYGVTPFHFRHRHLVYYDTQKGMASESSSLTTTSNTQPIGPGGTNFDSKVDEKAVLIRRSSPNPMEEEDDRVQLFSDGGRGVGGHPSRPSVLKHHEEEMSEPNLQSGKGTGPDSARGGMNANPDTPTQSKKRKRRSNRRSFERDADDATSTNDGFESPTRSDTDDNISASTEPSTNVTKIKLPFPWKLHTLLDDVHAEGKEDIVSWDVDGRSFTVHKTKDFCDRIMVKYFRQSKLASFTRQVCVFVCMRSER
jgi:hypothetical protein